MSEQADRVLTTGPAAPPRQAGQNAPTDTERVARAHLCARVRKRAELPPVSVKDVYGHPTTRDLATEFGDAAPPLTLVASTSQALTADEPHATWGAIPARGMRESALSGPVNRDVNDNRDAALVGGR